MLTITICASVLSRCTLASSTENLFPSRVNMLEERLLSVLNHLLAQNTWALSRLAPFSGRTGRISVGKFSLSFVISEDGRLASYSGVEHEVSIFLPPDTLASLISRPGAVMTKVQVTGFVELAETLGSVFRHLRWDLGSDLAGVVGEIAAERLVKGGASLVAQLAKTGDSLSRALAEYLAYETSILASKPDDEKLLWAIEEQRDAVDRLEARVRILERQNQM